MKKGILLAVFVMALAGIGWGITVNPASNALADSEATALTIIYRDANGDAAINNLTAAAITTSGNIATTAATVAVSTSATSANSMTLRGAFSSTELNTLVGSLGDLAINVTFPAVCYSTGGATGGSWLIISSHTAAAGTPVPCDLN